MPLVQTRGAASAQGFGEFAQATAVNYIEDVFSTYLYTGNSTSQTITNNIDLSTKGGLVWLKYRSGAASSIYHHLYDSARGTGGNASYNYIYSNQPDPQGTGAYGPTAFNTNGFTLNSYLNESSIPYVSWTWRKQPKFFDIVTYTGTGSNTTIAHNLGSVPGSIIVKRTDTSAAWAVYHRSLANTQYLVLNTTAAVATGATWWNSTTPTSAVFSVGTDASVNASGGTYVAYVFAHDAGGFGLAGTDNVISCGSYVGTGVVGNAVTLGYEPQWLMVKDTTAANDWIIYDNMRGMPASATNTGNTKFLKPNLSGAEAGGNTIAPTATGFEINTGASVANTTSDTYIYIAIRRGPMKVPTLGTSVFEPVAYSGTGTDNRIITSSITPDSVIPAYRNTTGAKYWYDRLRGNGTYLITTGTNAEGTDGAVYGPQFNKVQTGYQQGTSDSGFLNNGSYTYVNWLFKRAPSFFDEVCYTNPASSPVDQTHSHNLGVVPTLVITKGRDQVGDWLVLLDSSILGTVKYLSLNLTSAAATGITYTATTTQYTTSFLGNYNETQVAYLFATCAGVSKVGSYTGTGTTLQIDCGFTAGARFVLIKRTDSTGDWYVWDSARGIVAGNDPYLLLNDTAAEVTSTDYVDTYSAGFEISSTAPAAINASAGSFIFLAIA